MTQHGYGDFGPGVRVGVATPDGKGMAYQQDGVRWRTTDAQEAADRLERQVAYFGRPRTPTKESTMDRLQKYLAWLLWLQTLSTNLPAFIAAALAFYEAVKGLLPPTPELEAGGGLSLTRSLDEEISSRSPDPLVQEVAEAERRVLEMADGGAAAAADRSLAVRDGSRLRELFAFFMLLRSMFGL